MSKTKGSMDRIKIWLVIGLLSSLSGCSTYGNGPYYDGAVVVAEPDEYLFGESYDNGRDVHNYSQRGSVSRGAAHAGGSHAAAHSDGGRGGRR